MASPRSPLPLLPLPPHSPSPRIKHLPLHPPSSSSLSNPFSNLALAGQTSATAYGTPGREDFVAGPKGSRNVSFTLGGSELGSSIPEGSMISGSQTTYLPPPSSYPTSHLPPSLSLSPPNAPSPLPSGAPVLPGTRSRRSSTTLPVSLSLTSRSRSRTGTPTSPGPGGGMGVGVRSPPMSPGGWRSKRGSLDAGALAAAGVGGGKGLGVGVVGEEEEEEETGVDFGWEEAFASSDDDGEGEEGGFGGGEGVEGGVDFGRLNPISSRSSRSKTSRTSTTRASRVGTGEGEGVGGGVDIFEPGFVFGAGLRFEGEVVERVEGKQRVISEKGFKRGKFGLGEEDGGEGKGQGREGKGRSYRVVRQLGSGSFAVVYLVREVGGSGQEYALKCLSKRDLDQEQLDNQMFEATIHLSLPRHENIVTLHQTLQTRRWLFLLMEMCPGEDLFYWLEHSRDSPPNSSTPPSEEERQAPLSSSGLPSSAVPFSGGSMLAGMGGSSVSPAFAFSPINTTGLSHHISHTHHSPSSHISHTPTTPSLLAAYSANALLSNRRLKLISSMFVQMCEAVAICHEVGVGHRDIKPENFICCDSEELAAMEGGSGTGEGERKKVVVKLTDFGLATTDERNTDVECGSRPYMAYECRNNLGPDYAPGPADIWSLGIVLVNMLFHRQPWADPCPGDYNFDDFCSNPTDFLLNKFTGIGREVASFLAERVFALDETKRVSARQLGVWAKELPVMIGGRKAVSLLKASYLGREPISFAKTPVGIKDSMSIGNSILTISAPTPPMPSTPPKSELKTQVFLSSPFGREEAKVAREDLVSPPKEEQRLDEVVAGGEEDEEDAAFDTASRSTSNTKRRKRGTRKGKAAKAAAEALMAGMSGIPPPPTQEERDTLLAEMAESSQKLAREMSKTVKPVDGAPVSLADFPKLGELLPAKKTKEPRWKEMLTSGNPELAALARRVAEREGGGGNLSAPALMQHQQPNHSGLRSGSSAGSSQYSSQVSSTVSGNYNPTTSMPHATGIMAVESWRRKPDGETPADMGRGRPGLMASHQYRSEGLLGSAKKDGQLAVDLSPGPSQNGSSAQTSSKASSMYSRRSNDSTATFSTLSTFSTMSGKSTISQGKGHRSNVKEVNNVPWDLNDTLEGPVSDSRPARKTGNGGKLLEPISEKPRRNGGADMLVSFSPVPTSNQTRPQPTSHSSYSSTQTETPDSAGNSGMTLRSSSPTLSVISGSVSSSTTIRGGSPAVLPSPKIKTQISSFGKLFGMKGAKVKD